MKITKITFVAALALMAVGCTDKKEANIPVIKETKAVAQGDETKFGECVNATSHSFQLVQIDGEGAALVRGIALGDRTGIRGTDMESDFRSCGLSHLLAVSGSHLAVVTALVAWAVSRFRMRRVFRLFGCQRSSPRRVGTCS